MRPDDVVRLTHMRDAAASALRFVEGRRRGDLDNDEMPEIRWAAIVGMRNRLVHAYFDVDRDILWATVSDELPHLKDRLSRALGGIDSLPDHQGTPRDS